MSNNNYFTVAYKILSYLKYCYENGITPDPDFLNAETFNISQAQFLNTLKMLTEDGYIKGLKIHNTTTGPVVAGMQLVHVTSNGLEYLSENTMMKKAYRIFKEVRDWAPLLK